MRRLLTFFGLVLGVAACGAEEDGLKALVRQLGSGRYAEREEAHTKLLSLGWKVKERLAKEFERTEDLEVKTRLERILSRLGKPAWSTELGAALREAKAENKPLLVLGAVGGLKGYT